MCGRNLLDKSLLVAGHEIDSDNGAYYATSSQNWYATEEYIDCTALRGQSVIASAKSVHSTTIAFYDGENAFISSSSCNKTSPVTVPSSASYMRMDFYTDYVATAQLEYGSTATDYRPYQVSVTPELLTDAEGNAYELAALPDGTRDEVYVRDNGDGTGDVVFVERIFHAALAVADMDNAEDYPGWKSVDGLNEACPNTNSPTACINSAGFYWGRKYFIGVNTAHTGELWLPSQAIGMTQSEFKDAYPDLVIDFFVKRGLAKETVLGTIDMLDVPESVLNAWAETDLATTIDAEWFTPQGEQVLRAMQLPKLPDGTEGQFLRKTADGQEWGDVTAAGIGAAQASHKHPASDLTRIDTQRPKQLGLLRFLRLA